MTNGGRALRLSHVAVRIVATLTLSDLGTIVACERFSWTRCHALANGNLGVILTFWAIHTSLLLPLYVGFEIWWMRKREAESKALWIDATLAAACLVLLTGVVLYAVGHYAMF